MFLLLLIKPIFITYNSADVTQTEITLLHMHPSLQTSGSKTLLVGALLNMNRQT